MKTIAITGATGQLGQCFSNLSGLYPHFNFLFLNSSELNITSKCDLTQMFNNLRIDYCINCAAYTNVEKAESDIENAFKINAEALKNLAEMCKRSNSVLFHFSTDYVFDGEKKSEYKEEDPLNPLNQYGASKLKGEEYIKKNLDQYFIFRTSWLYSQYGHNFYNTILKKAALNETLHITSAQTGTPTNANDLAKFILDIIDQKSRDFGVYHYTNLGETTWYGFAKEILEISGNSHIKLIEDNTYQTIAKRPEYSVLDKNKLINTFNLPVLDWKESLKALYTETHFIA